MPPPKDPEKYKLWKERTCKAISDRMQGNTHCVGRVLSDTTKKKIGQNSRKTHPQKWVTPHISDAGKLRLSVLRKGKCRPEVSGYKHGRWKGGTSFLPYCFRFNRRRKIATRVFFHYYCIVCGIHVTENIIHQKIGYRQVDLHVHHVDHNKEQGCNGMPFNLVPLCIFCHMKEIQHEEEYRTYINRTLAEGFKWGIWSEQGYIEQVMYAE